MPSDDRDTVEQALATFVDAFNDLDRIRMTACFLDDATVFHPIGSGGYRALGFWIDLFDQWHVERSGPPYLNIQPRDLQIQPLGDAAAVVTFHLEHDPEALGRRTIVLCRTPEGWKIAHLHASTFPRETPSGG
jgi:ketosteroid isomerase-like protein